MPHYAAIAMIREYKDGQSVLSPKLVCPSRGKPYITDNEKSADDLFRSTCHHSSMYLLDDDFRGARLYQNGSGHPDFRGTEPPRRVSLDWGQAEEIKASIAAGCWSIGEWSDYAKRGQK